MEMLFFMCCKNKISTLHLTKNILHKMDQIFFVEIIDNYIVIPPLNLILIYSYFGEMFFNHGSLLNFTY